MENVNSKQTFARINGFCERIPKINLLQTFGKKIEDHFVQTGSDGDEIFEINRPKVAIQALIDYALSGKLHIPMTICTGLFLEELKYWGIQNYEMERCCFHEYKQFESKLRNIQGYENMINEDRKSPPNKQESLKMKLWGIVDRRGVTKIEKIFNYVSIVFIVLAGLNTTVMTLYPHLVSSSSSSSPTDAQLLNNTIDNATNLTRPTVQIPIPTPGVICRPCICSMDYVIDELVFEFEDRCKPIFDIVNLILRLILVEPPDPNMDDQNKTRIQVNDSIVDDTLGPLVSMNIIPNDFKIKINNDSTQSSNVSLGDQNFTLQDSVNSSTNVTNGTIVSSKLVPLMNISHVDVLEEVIKNIRSKITNLNLVTIADTWKFYDFIEISTTAFFIIEISLRILSCPNKKSFFGNIMNIFEIMLVLTQIFRYVIAFNFHEDDLSFELKEGLEIIMYFQIFRIFRLMRVVENVTAFRVLKFSFKTGKKDLGVMLLYLCVCMLIIGNLIYFFEDSISFPSIPAAYYWTLITMTTVGYGDMSPKTHAGKVIACCGALLGLLLFALFIPVVVGTFLEVYEYARSMRSQSETEQYLSKQNASKEGKHESAIPVKEV